MGTAQAWIAVIGGSLVIAAALWRVGSAFYKLAKKWDKLQDEHEVVLDTLKKYGTAIEQLQRSAQRRQSRNG